MNILRERIRRGDKLCGTLACMSDPSICEIFGGIGYDFVWIDTEHTYMSEKDVLCHLTAARASGTASIVRVPQNDLTHTKRILEMGPDGIIFPMVRSAEEVKALMDMTLYPPHGTRGFGPMRAIGYGTQDTAEYVAHRSMDLCRFIQIEHIDCIDELEKIVQNPYVDGFIFGPNDLSGSISRLGDVFSEPTVSLIKKAITTLRENGKYIGLAGGYHPDVIRFWSDLGVDMLAVGADWNFICEQGTRTLEDLRRIHLGNTTKTKESATSAERRIERDGFTVCLSEPTLYVDNESRGRSGHMTHAMAEFAPNKIIDFNANSSAKVYDGHSTYGWVEYRISEDGGETFSETKDFPYSMQCLLDGVNTISVEKAVACNDGRIVAICLRNCATGLCTPWDTPMTVTSFDGGETWGEPKELCPYDGRVYDAVYHEGVIYALQFCNRNFLGDSPEHVYRIFTSRDNGESFQELCVVPIPTQQRGYGALLFDEQNRLHVYAYNQDAEKEMDHVVSDDSGVTWHPADICYLEKGIRNPQVAYIDGIYILHGRCIGGHFVLYTSKDACTWDEGYYIAEKPGFCYYSNNIVLRDKNGGNRLLIQYSDVYTTCCVNVRHMWLRIEK